MRNIMKRLYSVVRWNDLTRPVNQDLSSEGYWERVYANRETEQK
jgi:hypothetical protein